MVILNYELILTIYFLFFSLKKYCLLYSIFLGKKVLLKASYPTSGVSLKDNQRRWLGCCIPVTAYTMFSLLHRKPCKHGRHVYRLKTMTWSMSQPCYLKTYIN